MVGDELNLILDCYRLAREYHVSPTVFLEMPLDEMALHRQRTAELIQEMQRMQRQAEQDA